MLKLVKFVSVLTFIVLCNSALFAADNGNGVDVTTYNFDKVFKIHAEWFTAYDPEDTVNYVYNESAGTATTSGELDTSFIFDKGNISVYIPTHGTGTTTLRLEGKTKDGAWMNIITKTYTAAMTIAESFPIVSYWDAVRAGLKVSGSAVDSVTIEGDFIQVKH